MSVYEVNLTATGTRNTATTFTTTLAWTINSIRIYARGTNASQTGALSFTVSDGTNSMTTDVIEIQKSGVNADYYTVPVGFTANPRATVTITPNRTRCNIYGATGYVYLAGGYANGAWNMYIDIAYTPVWESNPSGYFSPVGAYAEPFTFYEADEETHYPYNVAAWKFNPDINDGYPFFYSLEQTSIYGAIYEVTENGLIELDAYEVTADGLVPIKIKVI